MSESSTPAAATPRRKTSSAVRVASKATREQARDTGMALVLLLLLLALTRKREAYIAGAIALQLLNMIAPQAFRPAAVVWFGLSRVLGAIMSRVLLGVIFFLVVTPVAWCRRLLGVDALALTTFKASRESVMHERNHTFTAADIEHPY